MGILFCLFAFIFNSFFQKNVFKKFLFLKVLLFISFHMMNNSATAQTIKWDFDEGVGTDLAVQQVAHVTISKISLVNNYGTTNPWITTTSSSSGYIGASGNYNAGAASVSAPFDPTTSTYVEFSLSVEQGYSINVNAINFGSRSTGTGPQSFSIRSSIDAYGSDLSSKSLPADSKWYWYQNNGLTVSSTSTVTFRIYGFNGINSSKNTAVWRIDDLNLEVSVSPVQTYYRSRQNGNWDSVSTWEYSTDNAKWNVSSKAPTKDVEAILIQSGHTVLVTSPVSVDQTTVGGTLELQTGAILNINDGVGDDVLISPGGVLKVTSTGSYATSVQPGTTAVINISPGGKITIGDGTSSTGNGYEAFATSTTNIWNDGAVFEYNCMKPFEAPGLIYFPNVASTIIPVFRVSAVSGTPGVGSTKNFYVNGILEVKTNLTFSGTGDKYFRNGIRGSATLSATGTGQLLLNGSNAILEGSPLNLILSYNIKLQSSCFIPTDALVTISGANIDNNLTGNVFTINGTLDVQTLGIKNTNGRVILNGTLKTANPGGFSGSGSSIVSGSVLVNAGSIIELNAKGNQSLNARTDFKNLIFSGSGIKTPIGSFSPAGTITIKDNAIFDCRGRNIGDSSTNLTMSGNSRLIVDTYGPNPKMAGTYNLTGGVIEFRGSNGTAETIRSKNYQNIEITGNNILMSEGNITLNDNGTFTVKSGGIFSINDNTINGTPGGTQTITVKSGGRFKCGTNMGFHGATITPIPIKSSAINADIENIVVEPNSTIEYSGNGDQPITNAGGLVYQNLIISGSGNKTAPSGNLIIQGNLSKTTTASFQHNNATVILNGSSLQTYSCVSPQMVFNNLRNENTVGLNIDDSLGVYNQLSLEDNSITTLNADLSLLSSREQTASIGQLSTNAKIIYNAGRFIVERYINTTTTESGHQKSWQLLATPAFGETIFDAWQERGIKTISGYGTWITGTTGIANGFDAVSPAPSIKYYNPIDNEWIGVNSTYVNLENEKGYMIFIRGDRLATSINSSPVPTILRTRGKLYTPGFLPPTSIIPAGKFQCVGNPYASVIDFKKINSSNISSSYIAWDPERGGSYGYGGYQTISEATNYSAVPGGTSNYNSTGNYRYIQSGQAFFVSDYTSSDGFVSFSESCKVAGNYHLVNRQTEDRNAVLFANLNSKDGFVIDGNAVSFSKFFSNRIDYNDVFKISAPAEIFGIRRSGKVLVVEAREKIAADDTIFYFLKNLKKQDYQLTFMPNKIQSGFDAYLVDQYLHTERQISFTDTSTLNFSVTDEEASLNPERFFMVFRAAAGPLAVSFFSINAYQKDKDVLINWQVENENDIKEYELQYSRDGIHFLKIGAVSSSNNLSKSYNFVHQQPDAGIAFYRICINKINGEWEYKKVVKVFISGFIGGIQVSPNPIQQRIIHLQFIKQPLGKYNLNLYNTLGQNVFSEELIYKGEASLFIELSNNFTIGVYQLEIKKPNGERTTLKLKTQ